MYCTKCGNKNDDNGRFCVVCGTPLANNNQNNSSYVNVNANNQYNQNINPYYNQLQNSYYNQIPNSPDSKMNAMALAGFITSCGFVLFWGFAGLVGLILSLIGFNQTRERGERGKGFAIAGIIIGCMSIIVTILAVIYIANASSYELHRIFRDFYYDYYDHGTAAVKELFSMIGK